MALTQRPCTVQYRHLDQETVPSGSNLQTMLISALETQTPNNALVGDGPRHRILSLNQDNVLTVLNKISSPNSRSDYIAGQLLQITRQANMHALLESLEADVDEFLIQTAALPEGVKLARGILYFAVRDNHVGVIESPLRTATLERYFTAFLQKFDIISAGHQITLLPGIIATEANRAQSVKSLRLKAEPVEEEQEQQLPLGDLAINKTKTASEASTSTARVLEVLELFGWTSSNLDALRRELSGGGALYGEFEVYVKKQGRKLPFSRRAVEHALHNLPEDSVILSDGSTNETGGMVYIRSSKQVSIVGGLLDPSSAMHQIITCMQEWASSGRIDCTFE